MQTNAVVSLYHINGLFFFFLIIPPPPRSTLFPYTTLFRSFLSEERGEWPDIDLDLPSGDQREKAIQHVYKTYGVHGSAMTANVITYRDRSAAREVGKALGFSLEQADKLSKVVGTWKFGEIRDYGVIPSREDGEESPAQAPRGSLASLGMTPMAKALES